MGECVPVWDGIDANGLGAALHAVGLLPEECRKVELVNGINDTFFLRYEVNVKPEDLPKLAMAFEMLAKRKDDSLIRR